jgi:hypothetical protein
MLAHKAAADGGGSTKRPPPRQSAAAERRQEAAAAPDQARAAPGNEAPAAHQPPPSRHSLPAAPRPDDPVLKPRKKEFLTRKKLRKRGGKEAAADGDTDDPEARLRAVGEASKPAFGEQGSQPIKANLKRRHWTDHEKTAAERCKEVFTKQLDVAKRQAALVAAGVADAGLALPRPAQQRQRPSEAARVELAGAYRQHAKTGAAPPASLRSLAALVRRDAAKATEFHG